MGMVISGDIFQDKVNKLLGDIEGVKAYIDEILLLKKHLCGSRGKNLEFVYHTSTNPV